MKHFDKDLQDLADNGFRSVDDWASIGRDVVEGSAPRTTSTNRGRATPLFTRAQTTARPKAPPRVRKPKAVAAEVVA